MWSLSYWWTGPLAPVVTSMSYILVLTLTALYRVEQVNGSCWAFLLLGFSVAAFCSSASKGVDALTEQGHWTLSRTDCALYRTSVSKWRLKDFVLIVTLRVWRTLGYVFEQISWNFTGQGEGCGFLVIWCMNCSLCGAWAVGVLQKRPCMLLFHIAQTICLSLLVIMEGTQI